MLTIKDLLEKYPTGILSIVSDTFDLWKVCTKYLPKLKEQILTRDGKLVIRPDSGDPVDILCGRNRTFRDENYNGMWLDTPENKGVIELLWDIFGGTTNEQGYKVLDPHIGAIYGDSITLERAEEICKRLEAKGFASTNVVLGIGSFTYQYNTRDTFGFAMKATYVEKYERIPGVDFIPTTRGYEIFKDPITDDGIKKSAKGLLKVVQGEKGLELKDQISWEELRQENNLLKVVYENGKFTNKVSLTEIRNKLK
jgi:nicotinamide phosphoribosyltransferase